jgi:hypothetical protein
MNKHEQCDRSGPLNRGRFYRFGGILSLLCSAAAGVVSIYVAHITMGPLILVALLSMIAAILFIGGMVLLALGTIIEQLRDIKGQN